MRRHTVVRMTTIGLVTALGLSACITGGSDETSDGPDASPSLEATAPTEVTGTVGVESFYPEGSPDYQRLKGLAAGFEELYPESTVEVSFVGGADRAAQEARWRAGNPIEVNLGFFNATLPDGGEWVVAGDVLPLDDALDRPLDGYDGTWGESILPGVVPLLKAQGGGPIYAAPESVTTLQFFYNKKIFDEHGIEPPETLDQLNDVAEQLRTAGVAPFTVTGTTAFYMQMYWDYLALRYIGAEGVQQAVAGEAVLADLPGAAEAATALDELVAEENLLSGFRSTDFTAAQMAFFQGRAAMILMGSWLVGEMKDSIPADFELGTFPFPTVDGAGGDQEGLFGGVNAQVVAAKSANPEGGVEWFRFVASMKNQEAYVAETGSISPYIGVPSPPGFESVTAALEAGATFVPSYFGVPGLSQDIQAAYNGPISQLFFGDIDGATMLEQMSSGLSAQ